MNTPPVDRLDRIEAILERVAVQQETTAVNLTELIYKVDDFMVTATSVLGRNAILNDVVVGLNDTVGRLDTNLATLQSNFEENQKSTNAALERLEAILIKLMDS